MSLANSATSAESRRKKRGPIGRLRNWSQKQFMFWASRRSQNQSTYTLHRKILYIFPTWTGAAFLLLSIVVWLLGTNYQNNLILALAYMQISLFVIIILNTYNNLSGMQLTIGSAKSVCVGEPIEFSFKVASANKDGTHYVNIVWRGASRPNIFDFDAEEEHKIHISTLAIKRGFYRRKYLLVESIFPMGLLRCWTWLHFDFKVLVYPKPIPCPFPVADSDGGEADGSHQHTGQGDDFLGFKGYQPGDSSKHIAWTLYARGQGLLTKEYGAYVSSDLCLKWSDFRCGDDELALSHMCFWVKTLNQNNQAFAMELPGVSLPCDVGDEHQEKALSALALFGSQ